MKNILILLILLIGAGAGMAQNKDNCVSCHVEIESAPAQKFMHDIHYKKGVSCAGCHGGDPSQEDMDAAMDSAKGFRGIPKGADIAATCLKCHDKSAGQFKDSVHAKSEIANCITCHSVHDIRSTKDPESPVYATNQIALCGKCHSSAEYMKQFNPSLPTDQVEKYHTSIHGKQLAKGDSKVATCSDCHGSHGIFSHTDPRSSVYALNVPKTCAHCHNDPDYMKSYKIPTDQFDQYAKSVHGMALLKKQDTSAPACNDCHGNHGAAPPGIASVSNVCGECHALNAEYFGKSPHAKAFPEADIPQCEACHGNHGVKSPDDEMIHAGKDSVCEQCHSSGDNGYKTAQQIYESIQDLKKQAAIAEDALNAAEDKGMDVSDARFKAKDIPGALIKAQTVLHTASLTEVKKEIDPGLQLAKDAKQSGDHAVEEFYFRRKGLAISTLFITILAIALYMKIRQIEAGK